MDSARVLMDTVNDLERWILTGVSKSVCSLIGSWEMQIFHIDFVTFRPDFDSIAYQKGNLEK